MKEFILSVLKPLMKNPYLYAAIIVIGMLVAGRIYLVKDMDLPIKPVMEVVK